MYFDADSERAWLHRYAELIDDCDLEEVKIIMQQYAARRLNRQYLEEKAHEGKQGSLPA
jgi:hypothetical protein